MMSPMHGLSTLDRLAADLHATPTQVPLAATPVTHESVGGHSCAAVQAVPRPKSVWCVGSCPARPWRDPQ